MSVNRWSYGGGITAYKKSQKIGDFLRPNFAKYRNLGQNLLTKICIFPIIPPFINKIQQKEKK